MGMGFRSSFGELFVVCLVVCLGLLDWRDFCLMDRCSSFCYYFYQSLTFIFIPKGTVPKSKSTH